MRAYNFVLVLLHDFDRIQFRFRTIDVDQQSYEGDILTYYPRHFEENKVYQDLVEECLSEGSVAQYRREERALIVRRAASEWTCLQELLPSMKSHPLSEEKHLQQLRLDLYKYAKDVRFKRAN